MASETRYRNFAIVFYLDSAPENWLDVITDWHIESFLSPYHDQDKNPDGECKKPHYHLLLCFDGKKSISQAQVLSDQLSGTPVEVVQSIRGYARYLCHLDNPEKHQYSVSDVKAFAGGSYQDIIGLPYDTHKLLDEITVFCVDNMIDNLIMLQLYAIRFRPDWSRVIHSNTIYVNFVVRSIAWCIEHDRKEFYSRKTGVVYHLDDLVYGDDVLDDFSADQ